MTLRSEIRNECRAAREGDPPGRFGIEYWHNTPRGFARKYTARFNGHTINAPTVDDLESAIRAALHNQRLDQIVAEAANPLAELSPNLTITSREPIRIPVYAPPRLADGADARPLLCPGCFRSKGDGCICDEIAACLLQECGEDCRFCEPAIPEPADRAQALAIALATGTFPDDTPEPAPSPPPARRGRPTVKATRRHRKARERARAARKARKRGRK